MRDGYKEITAKIISELENGAMPWLKPWQASGSGNVSMPSNAVSKRAYSGANVFLLWAEAMAKGYTSGKWLTYRQAIQLGGNVRKGESGQWVFFLKKTAYKTTNAKGEEETKQSAIMRTYTVFNVAQCDGLPERLTETAKPKPATELDSAYKAFVQATNAQIRYGGNRACYIPSIDVLNMPEPGAFNTLDSFKATELHELTHWTGAKHRLNRDFSGRFGSESYAFEELVAEIGAAFLCAHLGVKGEQRHAGYIDSWLKVLKRDNRAIVTAASQASKAADLLRSFSEGESAESADLEQAA